MKESNCICHWLLTKTVLPLDMLYDSSKLKQQNFCQIDQTENYDRTVSLIQHKQEAMSGRWEHKFAELCEFRALHGHECVPKKSFSGLAQWVASQRWDYKKGVSVIAFNLNLMMMMMFIGT
jgi:hypothetical protein